MCRTKSVLLFASLEKRVIQSIVLASLVGLVAMVFQWGRTYAFFEYLLWRLFGYNLKAMDLCKIIGSPYMNTIFSLNSMFTCMYVFYE